MKNIRRLVFGERAKLCNLEFMQSECSEFDPKTAQNVVSNALYWVLELCRQMWMAVNIKEEEDKFL